MTSSMGPAVTHVYRYAGESELSGGKRPELRLVTCGGASEVSEGGEQSPFFRGTLTEPRLVAQLLRGLSKVVGSRFYVPPAMLAKIVALADPVVTSGGGLLRFEGFSACASAYARVDVGPAAYDGEVVGRGTTNVDFNPTMRAALAQIRSGEDVRLAVGRGEVVLSRGGAAIVERKVPLPVRWLRGFVEVQAVAARMRPEPAFELEADAAVRFLRSLPRVSSARHTQWVVPHGRGVRLSMTETPGALRLSGAERLRVLEDLAPLGKKLRAFCDDAGQASAWELDAGAVRFTLVLSGEVWRGFSGEGQALHALARKTDESALARTRAALTWQAEIRPEALAAAIGVEARTVELALLVLGARGLVGFDRGTSAFFHRELPFDLSLVEALQPRLVAARKLVAAKGVELAGTEVLVAGSGVTHRVRLDGEAPRCTCPWFAKHRGARGPCKHVLAAQIAAGGEEDLS
jgi:hypothetical protein